MTKNDKHKNVFKTVSQGYLKSIHQTIHHYTFFLVQPQYSY